MMKPASNRIGSSKGRTASSVPPKAKVVLPSVSGQEAPFDPYDESQVDLSGIVNAKGA